MVPAVQRLAQFVLHLCLRAAVECLAAALAVLPADVDLRHPAAVLPLRDAAFAASAPSGHSSNAPACQRSPERASFWTGRRPDRIVAGPRVACGVRRLKGFGAPPDAALPREFRRPSSPPHHRPGWSRPLRSRCVPVESALPVACATGPDRPGLTWSACPSPGAGLVVVRNVRSARLAPPSAAGPPRARG